MGALGLSNQDDYRGAGGPKQVAFGQAEGKHEVKVGAGLGESVGVSCH